MDEEPPFQTVECPECGVRTIFDDEEPFDERDRFWCRSCAHDLGAWSAVFRRFYGNARTMLDALLAKRRG